MNLFKSKNPHYKNLFVRDRKNYITHCTEPCFSKTFFYKNERIFEK